MKVEATELILGALVLICLVIFSFSFGRHALKKIRTLGWKQFFPMTLELRYSSPL